MLAGPVADDDERSWLRPVSLNDWRRSLCAGLSLGGASVADGVFCSDGDCLSFSKQISMNEWNIIIIIIIIITLLTEKNE